MTKISTAAVSGYNQTYAGGIIGEGTSDKVIASYRYSGQIFTRSYGSGTDTASNDFGTECSLAQLDSATFYTGTLGWSSETWDFSDLDFADGKTPKLKVF